MFEQAVQSTVKSVFAADYPYLNLPAVIYARVASVKTLDSYEINDLVIHNDETRTSFRGHITAHWYEYELTVLDRFGSPDPKFPAVPQVRSKKQFPKGAVVAAALPYGELVPAIIGEVRL